MSRSRSTWRQLASKPSSSIATAGCGPHRRRLRFEPLEDRRLLSITVNTLVDEADGSIVDGDISLRDAIALAPSGETINFSVTGTINLSVGVINERHLTIVKNLTINGPGANLLTINAFDPTPNLNNGDGSRVFNIDDGGIAANKNIAINGLTLTGGDVASPGGAIYCRENLSVSSCVISGNSSEAEGGGIFCGAVTNVSNLTVTDSTISGNSAYSGGAIYVATSGSATILGTTILNNIALYGGGIGSAGDVSVICSTISGNDASIIGGGIGHNPQYSNGGQVSISDSTVSGNIAEFGGGGVYNKAGILSITNCTLNNNETHNYDGGGISSGGTLTMTGSIVSGNAAPDRGGGIFGSAVNVAACTISDNSGFYGGGIYHRGNLTVADSTITGNNAQIGGGIGHQPFYFGGGQVSLTNSTISGNTAEFNGGGIYNQYGVLSITNCNISDNNAINYGGGGISSRGTLMVTGSTISGNSAPERGGGILGHIVMVEESTISGNSAHYGGGICHRGHLTVIASTISRNHATVGGGIGHEPSYSYGLSLIGSTISGNSAQSVGGGIFSQSSDLSITNCTITDNEANEFGGGGIGTAGGGILLHSIVAGNRGPGGVRSDIAGIGVMVTSFSLIGDNTGATITNNGGNLIGTAGSPIDPLLGPLADNGGPTRTHALLTGSPALDAGNVAAVAGMGNVPEFDQRGTPFTRVYDNDGVGGARIDIGAYERQSVAGLSLVVDTLVDESDGDYLPGDLSLREAIGLANGSVGDNAVTFAAALTSAAPAAILLTHGELAIRDGLTVNGPGAGLLTIDASGNDPTPAANIGDGSRIFFINDGDNGHLIDVEINGLTLTGGDAEGGGGAIANQEKLTVLESTISGNNGGGLFNYGGGIRNFFYGNLTITRSTISGNSARSGGGIGSRGNLTVIDSTISGNSAAAAGGGIDSRGDLSGNYTARIVGSTISGNTAGVGGGIYNQGLMLIRHGTITNNSADVGYGSGIASEGDSTYTRTEVSGTIIAGNANTDVDVLSFAGATFQSHGYNVIGAGSGLGGFNQTGDQIGIVNPMLGDLADNGGPTLTHALLAGSPALDLGNPAEISGVGGVPDFDQRGAPFTRIFDGDASGSARIDIGAFELQPLPIALFGDYNRNGSVDAADYVVWRKTLGNSGVPAYSGADGDGDATIDQDDNNVWRAQFGMIVPAPGAGSATGEPTLSAPAIRTRGPAQADLTAVRVAGFALLDSPSRGQESGSRSRGLTQRYEFAESGSEDLLLLAIDRVEHAPPQDVAVVDDGGSDDVHEEEENPWINDELPTVALVEWRPAWGNTGVVWC